MLNDSKNTYIFFNHNNNNNKIGTEVINSEECIPLRILRYWFFI